MRRDLRSYNVSPNRKVRWTVEDVTRLSAKTLKQQKLAASDKLVDMNYYIKYKKDSKMIQYYTENATKLESYIQAIDIQLQQLKNENL
jgi:23S rRNA G2445 N2-methylase RlmL